MTRKDDMLTYEDLVIFINQKMVKSHAVDKTLYAKVIMALSLASDVVCALGDKQDKAISELEEFLL